MFILNQERNKAINLDECEIKYLSVRNKSLNIMKDGDIYEETIGDYDSDDQAKAEMYRLIKCLSDGHKLFIISNPKNLVDWSDEKDKS